VASAFNLPPPGLAASWDVSLLLLLPPVQAYFADEQSKGRTLSELYELVQHAGNVLPRL
jgi:hypothetical protein